MQSSVLYCLSLPWLVWDARESTHGGESALGGDYGRVGIGGCQDFACQRAIGGARGRAALHGEHRACKTATLPRQVQHTPSALHAAITEARSLSDGCKRMSMRRHAFHHRCGKRPHFNPTAIRIATHTQRRNYNKPNSNRVCCTLVHQLLTKRHPIHVSYFMIPEDSKFTP